MNDFQYDTLLNLYNNNKESIENIKDRYLCLLTFLTDTPVISTKEFIEKIIKISNIGDIIICYSKNKETQEIHILGSGTVIYEPKIIHGCKNVGHIEDIVVDKSYRSYGIGKEILKKLIEFAKNNNCYKVILDCKCELENFYEKNDLQKTGIQMSKYF
jgi:glucosamine-phosphate N-acetyltransferase